MSVVVTFYNNKIDDQIVQYQKKVFDHFGLKINQINSPTWPCLLYTSDAADE